MLGQYAIYVSDDATSFERGSMSLTQPAVGTATAPIAPAEFELSGNAQLVGDALQITQVGGGQQGTAFAPLEGISGADDITVRFEMYTGDSSGADGLCMNLGATGGRYGEDGVAEGFWLCFDEWSNGANHGGHNVEAGDNGDHGVIMFMNGNNAWSDCAPTAATAPRSRCSRTRSGTAS